MAGSTLEERDDWVHALNSAIEENAMKRNTFEAVRAGTQVCKLLFNIQGWQSSAFLQIFSFFITIFAFKVFQI